MARFADRRAAGGALGPLVAAVVDGRPLVLGLPRGGIPVAVPVAQALDADLDAVVVRKLRTPGHPELAMGALARLGGRDVAVRQEYVLHREAVPERDWDAEVARAAAELALLAARYRPDRPPPDPAGRVVVVVDDGLATGATMSAAVRAVRAAGARRVVVAAPVGSVSACRDLAALADVVVCPARPEPFRAVSLAYEEFAPPSDAEVRDALTTGPG